MNIKRKKTTVVVATVVTALVVAFALSTQIVTQIDCTCNYFGLSAERRNELEIAALKGSDAYAALRLDLYCGLHKGLAKVGDMWLYRAAQLGSVMGELELHMHGLRGNEEAIFSARTVSQFLRIDSSELAKSYVKAQYARFHGGNAIFALGPGFPHDDEPISRIRLCCDGYEKHAARYEERYVGPKYFCRFPRYGQTNGIDLIMVALSRPTKKYRGYTLADLVCQECATLVDSRRLDAIVISIDRPRDNASLVRYPQDVLHILHNVCREEQISSEAPVVVAGRRSEVESVVCALKKDFNASAADDDLLVDDSARFGMPSPGPWRYPPRETYYE